MLSVLSFLVVSYAKLELIKWKIYWTIKISRYSLKYSQDTENLVLLWKPASWK